MTAERRAQRQAPIDTVGNLIADWLKRAQGDRRSREKTERALDREVFTHWAARPMLPRSS